MRCAHTLSALLAALSSVTQVVAVKRDTGFSLNSAADIKSSAATIAYDLLSYYKGNQTGEIPGILPGPPPNGDYYWIDAGAMWQLLIDYWYYTGDASYNDVIMQALMWQRGDDNDFMPRNWTLSMGNDDQGFWATAAMAAAERGFPNPPADTKTQWVSMVEAVFNEYVERYDTKTCGGGLRWQIPNTNAGYDYKNSISTGFMFSLSARLARFTGNKTYADWADKTWDWVEGIGLIDNKTYAVYDGANVETGCTKITKFEFSYDNAIYVLGASHMYNYTNGDEKWKTRISSLTEHGLKTFFKKGVAFEASCEGVNKCTTEMKMFKGILHQWYAASTEVAPFIAQTVLPVLMTSAQAAVKVCTGETGGGGRGRQCGFQWSQGTFNGNSSASEEMSVLGAVSGLLVGDKGGPLTEKTANKSGGGGGSGSGSGSGNGNGSGGNGTSSDKNGKGSGALKTGVSVVGVTVVSVGTLLFSLLAM